MLLRRITKHVKDQNWFAVALDFVIVVVGILIAFQITEWNQGRSNEKLRVQYLERLQTDLNETIKYLSANEDNSEQKIEVVDAFVATLNAQDSDENELILSTKDYFYRGTLFSDFKVFRSTFDDLTSSGNLGILRSHELSAALVTLNTNYAYKNEDFLVNTDWILPFESVLATEFDWFRFDELTSHLFPSQPSVQVAAEIRLNEDKLRRHAALHYWLGHNLKRDFRSMVEQSQQVLDLVNKELEKQ